MKDLWFSGLLVLLLSATASTAQASYVNSCLLKAEILAPTTSQPLAPDAASTGEATTRIHVRARVFEATPDGRADSGCTMFLDGEFDRVIHSRNTYSFQAGDRIRIQVTEFDDRNISMTETVRIKDD
ncbi:hypothetical protein [Halomonas cupida]|uniref:hypothetical protein n=1 Tax=Halomonas cupida TaxID=44933 RepID=UPI003A923B79